MFKQILLNGSLLKEVPFQREFELQGYLIAHPELLSLVENNDDFRVKELIGVERKLKHGRVDMIVEYSSGKIAIIELKRGVVVEEDYEQLKRYLDDPSKVKALSVLRDYKKQNEDFDEEISGRNMFGVLVGRSFSAQVMELLKKPKTRTPIINGLTIKRYKTDDNEYLMTTVISNFSAKDYQKYLVDGKGPFGKGRMVLAVIKEFVSRNSNISYDELISDEKFPIALRGTKGKWGCVSLLDDAKNLAERTQHKRHFLDAEDVIMLKDGFRVVVSSQWGIGNIDAFIKKATKLGVKVEKVGGGKSMRNSRERGAIVNG